MSVDTLSVIIGILVGLGAIGAALLRLLRWLSRMSRILEDMQANGKARRDEQRAIFFILGRVMRANKATLEAVRDGECNGNVSEALAGLSEAEGRYEDLFLDSVERRERVEESA